MTGLRVVIDSNMLQSEELSALLSISADNRAVLTDYAWMEAYKTDPVRSIGERLSVLQNHPQQVIVLKSSKALAALDARAPGLANRMISPRVSRDLQQTFQALEQARSGDAQVIAQILQHGANANEQMNRITEGVPEILAALPEMQESIFTQEELRRCRTGAGYTPLMVRKILGSADQIFELLVRMHRPRGVTRRARNDMFLYRFALATTIYLLRWIRSGSPKQRSHSKVRNDFIDLNFATVGTYFNGLMTEDQRARDVHLELRVVLEKLGARMPNHYVEGLLRQLRDQRS